VKLSFRCFLTSFLIPDVSFSVFFVQILLSSTLADNMESTIVTDNMDAMAHEPAMSEDSASPEEATTVQTQAPKRTADAAGLKPGMRPAKSAKRRASKACQCCRARKVRCNVVEHGAPCTNCRLDEVECIVSESKRKK